MSPNTISFLIFAVFCAGIAFFIWTQHSKLDTELATDKARQEGEDIAFQVADIVNNADEDKVPK